MVDLKERLDKKKKTSKKAKLTTIELVEKVEEGHEKNKSTMKKKRKREKGNNVDAGKAARISPDKLVKAEGETKKNKSQKKKRKDKEKNTALVGKFDQLGAEVKDGFDEQNDDEAAEQSPFKTQGDINSSKGQSEADIGTEIRTSKPKKTKNKKKKKKEHDMSKEVENLSEKIGEADQDEVYCISSGDEDCSKGMKKWLTEYRQSRPGLKVLQQSIDAFIIAHEEKLEQERKQREARDAEGGWTVVVHLKGRKKTTESESGITVGAANKTVVEDQVTKKKRKEVGLNFYRFQRREAQRNEILALQSKFEQEKKRIQQLRAARKFRPY